MENSLFEISAGATAFSVAVVLAVVYLLLVRFVDMNEKEPMWAMGVVFGIGAVAATALYLGVGSATLELDLVAGPIIKEITKFVAIGAGFAVLMLIGRSRGIHEVNGLLDGVVYGAAGGLGFATGAVFVRTLLTSGQSTAIADMAAAGPVQQLWPMALVGLSEGVFGAIIGAGISLAIERRRAIERVAAVAVGAGLAVGARVAYTLFARGDTLGPAGQTRALIALALPVVAVLAVIVFALRAERRAIATHLPAERDTGVVTDEELVLLTSFFARRKAYLRRLLSGDVDGWMALKVRHNRQVQLAFAKAAAERHRRRNDAHEREMDVARLRAAVLATRDEPSAGSSRPQAEGIGA